MTWKTFSKEKPVQDQLIVLKRQEKEGYPPPFEYHVGLVAEGTEYILVTNEYDNMLIEIDETDEWKEI